MPPWTCPNPKCEYDNQLEPGRSCPICKMESQEVESIEFGKLLKEKEATRKLGKRNKRYNLDLKKVKFCPKCGSFNITFLVYYTPSIWKCLDCDYEGVFVLEGEQLAEKIREGYNQQTSNDEPSTV